MNTEFEHTPETDFHRLTNWVTRDSILMSAPLLHIRIANAFLRRRFLSASTSGSSERTAGNREDDIIYIGVNAFWEKEEVQLPKLPLGRKWRIISSVLILL